MATETTARQFIFAALIFGAIITGTFTLIAMSLPEDTSRFEEYNSTFNKFNTLKANADTTKNVIEDAEPSSGILGIINGLVESSWGALKLVWGSVTVMTDVLGNISDNIGVPVWFTGLLIGIITITVAFALMAAWFKWHI